MRMNWRFLLSIPLAAIMLLGQGCATAALWQSTDPEERMLISAMDISHEELERQGIHYEYVNNELGRGFLVQKSALEKFRDYNLRLLGTPVTVVIDSACIVAVVGLIAFIHDPAGTVAAVKEISD